MKLVSTDHRGLHLTPYQNQNWWRKFGNALRGIVVVLTSQRSFQVHLVAACLVALVGMWLQVSINEARLLVLCVTVVMAAEILNTSVEFLAREITTEKSPGIRDALDAAAGGVLVASIGAAIVGVWIFLPRLIDVFWISG